MQSLESGAVMSSKLQNVDLRRKDEATASMSGWSSHSLPVSSDDVQHNSFRSENISLGMVPLQPGETLDDDNERPLSAPPPPGFGGGPEERHRLANEMLWGYPKQAIGNTDENVISTGPNGNTEDGMSSFSNLAAVLGSGLAQSMEEATKEGRNVDGLFQDLSYHRQTRHAASRLIGSSPPRHNDPVVYSNTNNNNNAQHSSGPTPSSLQINTRPPFASQEGSGFPSALSTPQRNRARDETEHELRRSTTPIQMFPGQSGDSRRALPASREIGTSVAEPDGDVHFSSAVHSKRMDPTRNEFTPNYSVFSMNAQEFKPQSEPHKNPSNQSSDDSTLSDTFGGNGSEFSIRQAEADLKPFLWDIDRNQPSRTIAILRVSWLRVPDVRSSCERFGLVETFRADFATRGIFFVSYFDIRSAEYAAAELQPILQRMSLLQGCSDEVLVRYCIPLNASSQFDEGQIIISDLPNEVDEHVMRELLTVFGAVRAILEQDHGLFAVEYFNVQDAKQALLEVDSSRPWGSHVNVEVGLRNPIERKKGRDLLTTISRWRQALGRRGLNVSAAEVPRQQLAPGGHAQDWHAHLSPGSSSTPAVSAGDGLGYGGTYGGQVRRDTTELILGPDGRYQQVIARNPNAFTSYSTQALQPAQQIVHGPNGQIYITAGPPATQHSGHIYLQQSSHHQTYPATVITNNAYADGSRQGHVTTPYYTHMVSTDAATVTSGRSHGTYGTHGTHVSHQSGRSTNDDNRHLMLDLDVVEAGMDGRTSLMVRNIPNKYTQQMLLSEFMENGHGPGVIDFFYLPIDFKNRCNRGYAFINFVDCQDISPFHRRYYGKHWRTFNSDKICDITYARIQGKAAMLKRFENSALMEKDDEYKPLVFVSDGPEKGSRVPFPDASADRFMI